MCRSELIKTFDFPASVSVCVCVCARPSRACTRVGGAGLAAAAVSYQFLQPCHTNYSPYLLTFSVLFSALDRHL